MRRVILTEEEVNNARDFAFELIRKGKKGTFENYFIGTLGEIAYAKHTGRKANLEVYERRKGDNGADFKDVQVKTTTWTGSNKQLKVSNNDRCLTNPDVTKLVLAHVVLTNPTEVFLVGEICKEVFLMHRSSNSKWGYWTIDEEELYDVKKGS